MIGNAKPATAPAFLWLTLAILEIGADFRRRRALAEIAFADPADNKKRNDGKRASTTVPNGSRRNRIPPTTAPDNLQGQANRLRAAHFLAQAKWRNAATTCS